MLTPTEGKQVERYVITMEQLLQQDGSNRRNESMWFIG